MTEPKLDIFQLLNNISKKNKDYYSQLTEEQQKAFQPFVVMRWLTGTSNAQQVYFLNALVNPFVFSLANHKQLLYYLMTTTTKGTQQRYTWVKNRSKKVTGVSHVLNVIKTYFKYNTAQAIDVLPILTDEDIISCAEQLGYQPDEIVKIKKELKNRNDT